MIEQIDKASLSRVLREIAAHIDEGNFSVINAIINVDHLPPAVPDAANTTIRRSETLEVRMLFKQSEGFRYELEEA